MGMDLSVYRLVEPVAPGEDAGKKKTRRLYLEGDAIRLLKELFPNAEPEKEIALNSDRLKAYARQERGVPKEFTLSDWDFKGEQGWAEFSDPYERLPDHRIEVRASDYLEETGEISVEMVMEELGYLRKPFRFASTPIQVENGTVQLTADNFTGARADTVADILGEKVMEDAYGVFFTKDLPKLRALKDLCNSPENWQSQVLDKMGPNCVTIIDW